MTTEIQNIRQPAGYGLDLSGMPLGVRILFDDRLYERCKQVAKLLSDAEGFVPPHLVKKGESCFQVVLRSMTWKLDPSAVMLCTYQTPGGRIGFEGKLIQAIMENSGKLDGPVDYELIGDWSKIMGNYDIRKSDKGKDYAVPKWTRMDARSGGVGVIVSAQVKGEKSRRSLKFMLESCFPLNSTLWATRPEQQIKYTACRAFANTVAPGLLMGIPFEVDREAGLDYGMVDVTPTDPARPQRSDFPDGPTIENGTPSDPIDPEPEPEQNEEEPQFGVADAFEMGRLAFTERRPRRSPPEWEGVEELSAWRDAFLAGYDEAEREAKAQKGGDPRG